MTRSTARRSRAEPQAQSTAPAPAQRAAVRVAAPGPALRGPDRACRWRCACNVARVRPLTELTGAGDPAWGQVTGMIAQSPVPVEVLPPDRAQCGASSRQLQVTVRSALGAVALNTGGMLVDHRWVRVYGGIRGSRRDAGARRGQRLPRKAAGTAFPRTGW